MFVSKREREYTLMKTQVVCLSGGLMKPVLLMLIEVYFVYRLVYAM